jgi:membrane fusion protein (multidrug efflux system)
MRHLVFGLAALAATSTLVSCTSGANAESPKAAETAAQAVPVEVAPPLRSAMQAVYTGTATLEAEADAEVVARVGGEVTRIHVEEGQRVKAGQVLAALDAKQLRLQVLQAKAQLAKVQRDYQRQQELARQGLIAASALEGLRYDLDNLRASHELAQLQLAYTDIRAPFAGVVARRSIKLGQNLQVGAAAFRITNPVPLKAAVFVPERELRRLKVGQSAVATVDALPGRQYAAQIALVSPTIDAATATFKVTLTIADPQAELKPGMFARLGIVFERKPDAVSIPRVALVEGEDQPRIFLVAGGKAKSLPVQLGLSEGPRVEVLTPLPPQSQIVVVGQNGLKDGNPVKIVQLGKSG